MATLEKIRAKAGLLVIVIGLALFAFILGDLLSSGHTYFRMSEDKVLVINGDRISTTEFAEKVDEMTKVYKIQSGDNSLTSEVSTQINQSVYESIIRESVLLDATKKIGMIVSTEELADMIQGDHIAPMLQQMPMFRNPQTGAFDKSILTNFLQNILATEQGAEGGQAAEQLAQARSFWMFWEKNIKQQRLEEKYNNLLRKAITPNKIDLLAEYEGNKVSSDFAYTMQPYSSIADSTIQIKKSEIEKLYNAQKENFKQGETRGIKYFTVDLLPSQEDFAQAEENINNLKDQFTNTTDIAGLVNINSDIPYTNAYYAVRSMNADLKKFAETATAGSIEGPFFEDNTYKMYRMIGKTTAPDSLSARHIMIPLQDEARAYFLADSLLNALRTGGDFTTLAAKYSVDQTAKNGGKLGWFTEETATKGIGEDFKNACFSAKGSEYFTVKSLYGMHVVQITERTANIAKANIAQLVMNVKPSSKTYNAKYNELNQFIANNNTVEKFEKAAPESGYNLQTNANLTMADFAIGNVADARQAIRWAFNNKVGMVSELFEISNQFIVMAITDATKAGYVPMAKIEDRFKNQLLNEKKGEIIVKKLTDLNLNNLPAYAQAMGTSIDTAKFVTFNTRRISPIGDEPKLCALATAAAKDAIQKPIAGNNGVYVISVTNKTVNDQPMNAEVEKQKLLGNMQYRIMYQAFEVLRNQAKIEDFSIRAY